jgi:hypothetical protein
MTGRPPSVRRRRQTFLPRRWIELTTQDKLSVNHPREGVGRSVPARGLESTSSFSRHRLEASAPCSAAALSSRSDAAGRQVASSPTSAMTTTTYSITTTDLGDHEPRMQQQRRAITDGHQTLQVIVRVFGGSSEGEGGTPLPLETPLDNPYNIEGSLQGVVSSGR